MKRSLRGLHGAQVEARQGVDVDCIVKGCARNLKQDGKYSWPPSVDPSVHEGSGCEVEGKGGPVGKGQPRVTHTDGLCFCGSDQHDAACTHPTVPNATTSADAPIEACRAGGQGGR